MGKDLQRVEKVLYLCAGGPCMQKGAEPLIRDFLLHPQAASTTFSRASFTLVIGLFKDTHPDPWDHFTRIYLERP
jgi:hypothetical protein